MTVEVVGRGHKRSLKSFKKGQLPPLKYTSFSK